MSIPPPLHLTQPPSGVRVVAKISAATGESVSADDITAIPLLRDAAQFVTRHPGCIRRRLVQPGEAICRQGDAGRTAYYLRSGTAIVHLEGGPKPKPAAPPTLWERVARVVGGKSARASSSRKPHEPDRPIGVDGAAFITYGKRVAELNAGDLFGEIACLTRRPRSATVIAQEPCEVLEIIRTVLERLREKSGTFKDVILEADRRKLSNVLRVSPVFRDLDPPILQFLTQRARPIEVSPGSAIFREGDPADALYVIRVGQVRVWKRSESGGEITLSYLSEGEVFGEMGILEAGRRTASCGAYGQDTSARQWYAHPSPKKIRPTTVELFRIDAADCIAAFESDPKFRRRLERLAARRKKQAALQSARTYSLNVISPRAEQLGLHQGQRLLVIDLERCTRCDQCVDACVASHDDGLPRLIREGPRMEQFQVPSRCRSCLDPVCMIGCPVGSIARQNDLSMFIEDWCIGCGICAENCPYGSIQMHPRPAEAPIPASPDAPPRAHRVAAVCDQCHTLPAGPACQYACPHDAIGITDWSKAIAPATPAALDTFNASMPSTLSTGLGRPAASPSPAAISLPAPRKPSK